MSLIRLKDCKPLTLICVSWGQSSAVNVWCSDQGRHERMSVSVCLWRRWRSDILWKINEEKLVFLRVHGRLPAGVSPVFCLTGSMCGLWHWIVESMPLRSTFQPSNPLSVNKGPVCATRGAGQHKIKFIQRTAENHADVFWWCIYLFIFVSWVSELYIGCEFP